MSYPNNVLRLTVPNIPNAFIFVSGSMAEDREYLKPHVSFAYIGADVAAEWMPPHGPIQILRRCEPDAEGANPHHVYPFQNATGLEWSQRAVEDEGLAESVATGDFAHVFRVLRSWSSSRESDTAQELVEAAAALISPPQETPKR